MNEDIEALEDAEDILEGELALEEIENKGSVPFDVMKLCTLGERKKVGYKYEGDKAPFQYKQVLYLDGWADAQRYLPADYDLVLLKLDNGRVRAGWSTGCGWDGLKLQPEERVLYWKRKEHDDE